MIAAADAISKAGMSQRSLSLLARHFAQVEIVPQQSDTRYAFGCLAAAKMQPTLGTQTFGPIPHD